MRGLGGIYGSWMALFHVATVAPTKADLISEWVPTQPWGPVDVGPAEVVGAFRFDDPAGLAGIETHLVTSGGSLLQVPLTYREEPLEGADGALICEMEHSVLGTRWVYDGFGDPVYLLMLAAVAMTGQGEALGMALHDGRWYMAPASVRIHGGGWTGGRAPIDGFELARTEGTSAVFQSDHLELVVHRRPVFGEAPAIGLTATWDSHDEPVVLAEVTQRS